MTMDNQYIPRYVSYRAPKLLIDADLQDCVNDLDYNPPVVEAEAIGFLFKIVRMIRRYPNDERYRQLEVSDKAMKIHGVKMCLLKVGFQYSEIGQCFILPHGVSLDNLKSLEFYLRDVSRRCLATPLLFAKTAKGLPVDIMSSLLKRYRMIYLHEETIVQLEARSRIPISLINAAAEITTEEKETAFFTMLLRWFKLEFFEWLDSPTYVCCPFGMIFTGTQVALEPEMGKLKKSETYQCKGCFQVFACDRLNHPSNLLKTKRGRCGEWANCFTLLLRSLRFDTRMVEDFNDHVWTEVWSPYKNRWVHIDSCEAAVDTPLLYEIGWQKKLSYVVAISKDEVQDVTWRYVQDFNATLKRRVSSEEGLLQLLLKTFNRRLLYRVAHYYGKKRVEEILPRRALEWAEMLSPPKPPERDLEGRTSGSFEWRMARGEAGNYRKPHIFKPTQYEIANKQMIVSYCCRTDRYSRYINKFEGWNSCTYHSENIARKEELDWKMVYLARIDGSKPGILQWKFSLEGTDLELDAVTVTLNHAIFQSGMVIATLKTEKFEQSIAGNTKDYHLYGGKDLTIEAVLDGGEGDCSFQHAQVFRQSLVKEEEDSPFQVAVTFQRSK